MTLAHPADQVNQMGPEDLGSQGVPCFLVFQVYPFLPVYLALLLLLVIQAFLELQVVLCRIDLPLLVLPVPSAVSLNTCHSRP